MGVRASRAEACTGSPATGASPIDRAYLARFTLGNVALEREILELFAAQTPLYVAQLRAALTQQAWKQAAHTIKGSALAVGARRLASLAQMAEQLDIESNPAACGDRQQPAVDAVAAGSDEVCRYIACLFATP